MTTMATVHAEVLDEAYERLHRTGPEFAGWLSNHGPMAVDAMIRLGHPDGVPAWIDRYERRLEEPPGPRWSISEADWREALGDASRLGDWLAFFGRLVAAEPWRDILRRWWPRQPVPRSKRSGPSWRSATVRPRRRACSRRRVPVHRRPKN